MNTNEKQLKTQKQILLEIYQNEDNPVNNLLEEIRLFSKRTAQNYGYYDISDVLSFSNSKNPQSKEESNILISWYDNLMNLVWSSIKDHINNGVPLIKLEDIIKHDKYFEVEIGTPSRVKINI